MKSKGKRKVTGGEEISDNGDSICLALLPETTVNTFLCISLLGLLIRSAVSLHGYSGAGEPPKFGDFEAQRHWMEITINLHPREWYRNSTANDLSYWGIDYPPLTAYQSYFHGLILRHFLPESIALLSSHGYESYLGKLLMRWTVLSSDFLIFFPAVLWFSLVKYGNRSGSKTGDVARCLVVLLINPCLILIDHGHFQYNCISLGFFVAAVAAILSEKDLLGSTLFCLSLNHKQMSAYFAPAFFSHLLGKSLRRKNPLSHLIKLGLVVIGTFAAIWWPYIHSRDDLLQVFSRLAPFERGIYEDYVANFWCTTSVILKWKKVFTVKPLRVISLIATVIGFFPSMVHQVMKPSHKGFLFSLLNGSLSFYLFSYQVHEKSILIPLLAAALLALEFPLLYFLFVHYAMLSMFPLLCRDKLVVPYFALYALFGLLYFGNWGKIRVRFRSKFSPLMLVLFGVSVCLHVVYLVGRPPQKYPFLFDAIMMWICFLHFGLFALYMNACQWKLVHKQIQEKQD